MRIFAALCVLGGLALVGGYVTRDQVVAERAREHYTTNKLSDSMTEHTRVLRNGRYVTICYWVTSSFSEAGPSTDISTCHTEREYFNGH